MLCACTPGHPDPACPAPRRPDPVVGDNPCAHCGNSEAECRRLLHMGLTGCCAPCWQGPRHANEKSA